MSRSPVLAVGLLLSAFAFQASAAPLPDDSLRYRFKEGDISNYRYDMAMKMEMATGGQNFTAEITLQWDMCWKVVGIEKDGKARISQRYNNIHMVMDTAGEKAEFDTNDKTEPTDPGTVRLAKMLRGFAGAEATFTMDQRGQVSDMKPSEQLTAHFKSLADDKSMGEMFSEDGLQRMLNQVGFVLPEKTVRKGDSWSRRIGTMEVPAKTSTLMECTYDGPAKLGERSVDKITFKPTTSFEPDKNVPYTLTIKTQEGTGTVYIDRRAGRLLETTLTQKMDVDVKVGDIAVSQKIETKVSLKLVEPAK
jgi:hypothetical protein